MASQMWLVLVIFACVSLSTSRPRIGTRVEWKPGRSCPATGCLSRSAALQYYSGALGLLPAQPAPLHMELADLDLKDLVKFYLYTNQNPDTYQQVLVNNVSSLTNSNFNPRLPTVVLVHGYQNNINSEIIQMNKNGLLSGGAYNVFGVDWSDITLTLLYTVAANETTKVGHYLGSFIDFLVDQGADSRHFHLIGHSLGAHVVGFAGKAVTRARIPRITGLDPALPGFSVDHPDQRLDKGDADFVDCIHTCGEWLGILTPICDADFYPNGGQNPQPGCPWLDVAGVCSHSRSYEFMVESLQLTHKFRAASCTQIPRSDSVNCTSSLALMGYPASPKYTGIFYLTTNSQSPYAQG